jgi:hypothetical protein
MRGRPPAAWVCCTECGVCGGEQPGSHNITFSLHYFDCFLLLYLWCTVSYAWCYKYGLGLPHCASRWLGLARWTSSSLNSNTAMQATDSSRSICSRVVLCFTDSVISIRVLPPGHLQVSRACAGTCRTQRSLQKRHLTGPDGMKFLSVSVEKRRHVCISDVIEVDVPF